LNFELLGKQNTFKKQLKDFSETHQLKAARDLNPLQQNQKT